MTSTQDTPVRSAKEILAWSHSAIQPAMRAAVDSLSPPIRRVAAYHLGWTDQYDQPVNAATGKAVRPALTLLTAQASGGGTEAAIPAAAAIELVHNFSLLHDDVMDGDTSRRHRPTAWTVFGTSEAILTGDALLALALRVLAESHPAVSEQTAPLTKAVLDLITGQGADLAFEDRDTVEFDEYLDMANGKTAALIACACTLGALTAGAPSELVGHLRRFGAHLGTTFQFVDDMLGIWGDPAVTGKPVHSDLRSRKRTLPVITALNSGTRAGAELATLYDGQQAPTDDDLAHAAHLIDTAGGRVRCHTLADEHLGQALHHLREGAQTPQAAKELEALAHLITHRDH
jgi:geranylgeranyl diphosphate synthase type I